MLRQIFFLVTYAASLIGTFINPVYGVMGYIFEWGHHPPLFWWGNDWPDLRWSLLISVALIASFIVRKNSLKKLVTEPFKIFYWLVALWIVMVMLSTWGSVDYWKSWDKVNQYGKIIVLFYLMAKTPRTKKHYKWIIWMILFVSFDFGQIATFAGSNRNLKVSAPGASDENFISAHVLTAIPFLMLYFFSGKKWEKIAAVLMLPFILNLIVLANSRGAMLAVLTIVVIGFFVSKRKVRRYYIVGLFFGILLFARLANDQFWERQDTTESYAQDGSAQGRIIAWKAALEMIQDYPLGVGGGGFNALNTVYMPQFAERNGGKGKTVHNTYLLVATDWGIPGFILFMGFLIHAFLLMLRIRKDAKYTDDPLFYSTEGTALMMAFVGILVAGIFLNRPYADIIYWLSAMSIALRNIQYDEIVNPPQDQVLQETEQLYSEDKIISA